MSLCVGVLYECGRKKSSYMQRKGFSSTATQIDHTDPVICDYTVRAYSPHSKHAVRHSHSKCVWGLQK